MEEQRYSSFFSEPPVSEADSVRIHELCQRSYVRVRHVLGSLSANDFCFLSLKRIMRPQYRRPESGRQSCRPRAVRTGSPDDPGVTSERRIPRRSCGRSTGARRMFVRPRLKYKTMDQKVVCSSHAGCMPKRQRLTHKDCLSKLRGSATSRPLLMFFALVS